MKLHKKTKFDRVKKAISGKTYKNVDKYYVGVKKTNKYTVAFLVNPKGDIVISFTSKGIKDKKTESAFKIGEKMGKYIADKKVKDVYFNRSGYAYHGRIKAVCEGIRKSGVKI